MKAHGSGGEPPVAVGGTLPTFLIIGAPKSGTTSLAAYLDAHPQAYMSETKEIHFFDRNYAQGLDWYRSHFDAAGDARAVGEATPTYLLRDDALDRMARDLPDARLIAILRNPIEAIWSNYWFLRSLGYEKRTFEVALSEELEEVPGRRIRYIAGGRYVRRIRRVCELYPRDRLLVLLFEDLRDQPQKTFSDTCRFIGLDDTFRPANLGEVLNPSARLRSERLRQTMLRLRLYRRLPRRLTALVDRLNRINRPNPPMPEAVRARLLSLYADDNLELGAWLGRDLSSWNV